MNANAPSRGNPRGSAPECRGRATSFSPLPPLSLSEQRASLGTPSLAFPDTVRELPEFQFHTVEFQPVGARCDGRRGGAGRAGAEPRGLLRRPRRGAGAAADAVLLFLIFLREKNNSERSWSTIQEIIPRNKLQYLQAEEQSSASGPPASSPAPRDIYICVCDQFNRVDEFMVGAVDRYIQVPVTKSSLEGSTRRNGYWKSLLGRHSCITFQKLYNILSTVAELSAISPTPSTTGPPQLALPPAYAVRPEVRVSAHAMAQLCEQLPPAAVQMGNVGSRGDTVYPSARSALPPPCVVPIKHPVVTDTGPPPAYKDVTEMSLPAYVESR
ncbi:hypothetical protein EVAR_88876_1 [Eumeta japonica]|uniref:Uncharacterized protein n=1 Tax=Eumeta variegata TaxID=151549 RepID=A0A4C1XYP7_EUMVA|nr:hypothetical protein EVAR_88876_1 [Eumeta japonica]